jgi:hypothetical protein
MRHTLYFFEFAPGFTCRIKLLGNGTRYPVSTAAGPSKVRLSRRNHPPQAAMGWFSLFYHSALWCRRLLATLSDDHDPLSVPVLTLRGLKDTAHLRHALTGLIDFIESDDVTFDQLNQARKQTNARLRRLSNPGNAFARMLTPQASNKISNQAKALCAFLNSPHSPK